MKRILLTAAVSIGLTLASFAQGTIYFDGSDNNNPSFNATSEGFVFLNGILDTNTDVNTVLLGGSSPNNLQPVITLLLSQITFDDSYAPGSVQPAAGDIKDFANGQIYDTSGYPCQFPTLAPGTTAYFEIEAWTGNYSSYAEAIASDVASFGSTSIFTEVLSDPKDVPGTYIQNMPALNIHPNVVPEPTLLALVILGVAIIYRMRRLRCFLMSEKVNAGIPN